MTGGHGNPLIGVVFSDGPAGIRAPGTSGLGHPTERRPAEIHVFEINSLRIICMDKMEIDYRIIKWKYIK